MKLRKDISTKLCDVCGKPAVATIRLVTGRHCDYDCEDEWTYWDLCEKHLQLALDQCKGSHEEIHALLKDHAKNLKGEREKIKKEVEKKLEEVEEIWRKRW